MPYSRASLLFILSLAVLLTISCDGTYPIDEDDDCIGEDTPCEGISWSFVDKDTYENIMGTDGELVHPDSVVVLNLSLDTMYHEPRHLSEIWWAIGSFSPYQELNCFNQCVLDSAFSRYYYIYVGNADWDTLEVHFPARTRFAGVQEWYFNGKDARIPEDRTSAEWTSLWLQK